MFNAFFVKRRIKKYARKLPGFLKTRFGRKDFYSKGQVDSALRHKGLIRSNTSGRDTCYAYAMFCSPQVFGEIPPEERDGMDYEELRGEVSNTLFAGASDFSFSSLLSESANASTGAFGFGDSGDSGGGGDGGGY